jgi:hypothetical protein
MQIIEITAQQTDRIGPNRARKTHGFSTLDLKKGINILGEPEAMFKE